MTKYFLKGFMICVLFVLASTYTSAFMTDTIVSSGNTASAGVSSNSDIILNEFVPNPDGADDDAMPNGEWIELYNKGDWAINVNGWAIDAGGVGITINSSITNTGDTNIVSGGYLVVYRNGDSGLELVNSGDTVNLRLTSGGTIIDSRTYAAITEGKSWARVPNAGATWIITDPTKGLLNV